MAFGRLSFICAHASRRNDMLELVFLNIIRFWSTFASRIETLTGASLLSNLALDVQSLYCALRFQNLVLEMFIFLDALSRLFLELVRPLACFIGPSPPDLELLAREMKVFRLLGEISSSPELNPTYMDHLQPLFSFARFDIAAQFIKKCLVRMDDVSIRA